MPGILPMKLIKCGTSQTRIAQACDRCRSKKIRCDGVRPCCSQCANVGFECKTSDKLSRRAFPRGYTESLEERVRQLEAEVRELKELLDAKDEKIDMLSRIHSFSPYSPPPSGTSGASHRVRGNAGVDTPSSSGDEGYNDGFATRESTLLLNDGVSSFYIGASSGLPFLDYFKQKLRDNGRLPQSIDISSFFQSRTIVTLHPSQSVALKAPSRLASDHLVTSYFQEYHPLYPVLHRPTFLNLYEKLVASAETSPLDSKSLSNHELAQLFLVFALVSQTSERTRDKSERDSYDVQWQQALDVVLFQNSIETIQCLVLAQLYCLAQGDYHRLVHYRSLAVGMALRMGLNRSQKKFSLAPLNGEMRKRVFWCVYCLDSFSAATLGLPRLLNDEDIAAEYPSDIDDEYISAKGFLPTLPGDYTKISSALALFRCSRVLGNVLDSIYHTNTTGEQTYRRLKELEDELDSWKNSLAPHLRLEFVNGSPATNVVHSRSPFLVMAYHFTRILIHRPVMGSSLPKTKTSASFLAMVDSSKCIIQIVQLLSERRLGFSFCLNKNQLLVMSGFSILFGAVNYQQKGSLAKESEKLASAVVHELEASGYDRVECFRDIAQCVVKIEKSVMRTPKPSSAKRTNGSEGYNTTVQSISPTSSPDDSTSIRRRMSTISAKINMHRKDLIGFNVRRSAGQEVPNLGAPNSNSRYQGHYSQSGLTRRNTLAAPPRRIHSSSGRHPVHSGSAINLDFLNWNFDSASTPSLAYPKSKANHGGDEWEQLLAVMDASSGANIYGGGENSVLTSTPTSAHNDFTKGWGLDNYLASQAYQVQPQLLRHSSATINTSAHLNTSPTTIHTTPNQQSPYRGNPPSVSSFSTLSDEALSGEEGSLIAAGGANTELDLGVVDVVNPTIYDGDDDLGGLLAAHHRHQQQSSGYGNPTPGMVREELWGM